MTSAEQQARDDLPAEFKPPRAWPLVLVTLLSMPVAIVALVLTFQQGGRQSRTEAKVDRQYEVRCASQRERLRTPPETAMERKLRDLALKTFPQDCPKG